MTRSPRLLAFGGAHIDRRGRVSGAYVPAASNPGTLREEVGGGTFNALRWAVRRGLAASLCSIRGGDDAGDRVARAIEAASIRDLSAVFLDRTTPSYTALIDAEGELIAGLADMGLYDLAFPKQMRRSKLREAAAGADALLCDANLPTAALERCLDLAGGKPCFGIAISPAKIVRFVPLLDRLSILFMNRREAAALTGQALDTPGAELVAALRKLDLERAVVTGGSGPLLAYEAEGAFTITPPALPAIADVTGAGDALAGTTIAALMQGQALRPALREGIAASMLTLASTDAAPGFTPAAFARALALVPEPVEVA
ncbi:carbohydrate kinase family protein [Aquamicrobium soli]|jgi:sugar/nucleoside kinase (ribokinase family)|uniref:Carbohydrate kinase family protein n=1 Tax=Aquamicrobium soli TaxID=1811518 RepID=A0ABV7KGH9_9HYPH